MRTSAALTKRKPPTKARKPAGRVPAALSQDSREELLQAAGQIMTERGTVDVALSEVSQRSGLNSALIKYYFGNKAGMLMALVRSVVGKSIGQLNNLVKMPLTPEEKLRIHIGGMINTYYRYPFVNRLLHHIMTEEKDSFGPLVGEEIIKPLVQAQREILEEGIKLGVFRPIDPMLFYLHIASSCDVLFHASLTLKYGFGIEEVTDSLKRSHSQQLYEMVLNGIKAPPHTP